MVKLSTAACTLICGICVISIHSARGLVPLPDEPQRQEIEKVWQHTLQTESRAAAIQKLCGIASDERQNAHLRKRAVLKLADVQAVAATNVVRSINESITYVRREQDKNDEEYEARTSLKEAAALAYHQLQLLAANTAEKKYHVLTSALQGYGSSTADWAADQLVLRGEERVLAFIKAQRTSFSSAREFDLLCRKFAIMKSAETVSAALDNVIKGEHPQLEGLSSWERGLLKQWAMRMQQEISKGQSSDSSR